LNSEEIIRQFIAGMKATTPLEYIAVFTGITSVWFSRKEDILVYPTGLISTIIYIYLSFKVGLFGEGSVNFYYTVMSIWGWWLWSRKDSRRELVLRITGSDRKEWLQHLGFCLFFYVLIFLILSWLKKNAYSNETIPWADAFASSTAFTGMWLMAKKKVESWYWWIATNIISIPLYFVKHYVFTSVYYLVLLVLAVFGLIEWMERKNALQKNRTDGSSQ
jgi:nicotinamide mononucleotide transporter